MSPNLLSVVFFPKIRYIFHFLSLFFFVLAFTKTVKNKINNQKIDNWIKIFIGGVFIYLVGKITNAIFWGGRLSFSTTLSRIVVFSVLFFTILYSNDKTIKKCMNLYSNILVIFSILGIILFFLIIGGWQPIVISTIYGRDYNNYLLGLSVIEGFITLNAYRVQSFYDEPGTFAMALLPGIFWLTIANFNFKKCFILITGLFMTFSVGGWSALIICLVILIFNISSMRNIVYKNSIKILLLTFLSILLIFFIINNTFQNITISELASWITYYINDKYYNDQRLNQIPFVINLLIKNPQGPPIQIYYKDITAGIFVSFLEGGWIGIIGYCLIFMALLRMIFFVVKEYQKYQQSQLIALALSVVSLIIMSFQRGELLTFYYSIFIVGFFVNSYINYRRKNIN
ncbi:MAG: hypothetical protein N3E45_02415 [Oscillatoriaceae bacterium SKW80]|nr:hypothetical protein [Oscillatoriaceae bacterium SKW80]